MDAINEMQKPCEVMTVTGSVSYDSLGITDAHNHVWIEAIPGVKPLFPPLDDFTTIVEELKDYYLGGGRTILDCQPSYCGRNGNQLLALANASGVAILACTGFHRKLYYAPDFWMWKSSAEAFSDFFCSEIEEGLTETKEGTRVKAGFIKIALEAKWADCSQAALEGAADAAYRTKKIIEIHTEKGELAQEIVRYFLDREIAPVQIVLCHMDKKPDLALHQELAQQGVLLEYDTFYRPKYEPEKNLWPLLEKMVQSGYAASVALATDMADPAFYHHIGHGAGLASLPREIQAQLIERGFPQGDRLMLLGGNIARRLAGMQ